MLYGAFCYLPHLLVSTTLQVARGKSPASVDETYEDIDYAGQSHLEQQQQQWQQKTSSTEQHTGDHHAEYRHPQQAEEYAPSGSATKPHGGSSSGKGAVGAIKRMFGYAAAESSAASSDTASRRGWGQEATAWQEQEGPRGAAAAVAAASAEDALLHDAGVSGLPGEASAVLACCAGLALGTCALNAAVLLVSLYAALLHRCWWCHCWQLIACSGYAAWGCST